MQNQNLPQFHNKHFSGLAGLLANPAYLAHAENVYLHGGQLDPKSTSNLQSCAESAIITFGVIQATFAKLVMANTEARTWRVDDDEIADTQFQLSVLLGEIQPLLNHINNTLNTSQS